MNRVSTLIIGALFAVVAIEFGLLGASASVLSGSRDRPLPPIGERFGAPATPTATATHTPDPPQTPVDPQSPPPLSPPEVDIAGIDIRANPLTIACDGSGVSTVTVRLLDANGNPVPDGTWLSFNAYSGSADPWSTTTVDGYATTQAYFYGDVYGPNLFVESGLFQAGIRIRCLPQSNPCPDTWPDSPPPSPGCPEPPPTPYPCNPSPGAGPLSPPCEPEPPCEASPAPMSPPCEGPAPSPQTAFELALDCDVQAAGIQSQCTVAPFASADVGVVLTNRSGADAALAAFNFTVSNADISILNPLPGNDASPPNHDSNPDFNDGALNAAGWVCLPVNSDLTPGGPGSESLLSCYNPAGSAPIGDGASLIVATAHFATGQAGQPFLSIENAAFYDATLVELGSCKRTIGVEMNCHGALVDVGSPSPPTGPIPTSTRASTLTPSATRTPVPTATRRAATRTPATGHRCADVNGDGRVTATDLREIVRGVQRGPYDATYDINRDGRLGVRDVLATMRQLGGRC